MSCALYCTLHILLCSPNKFVIIYITALKGISADTDDATGPADEGSALQITLVFVYNNMRVGSDAWDGATP